jgi:uncharacterized membrane protein YraQ (UPF0718 family)
MSFKPGLEVAGNFIDFATSMLKVLPVAFLLIGLFEVWVDRSIIEENFGHKSGFKGYFWAILLASTTVGGTYVAFPVAYSLYQKGAKYSTIFTYIGAAALVRIPMTLFEASFLGIKFSLIRLGLSLPLIILSSIWLEKFLNDRDMTFTKDK